MAPYGYISKPTRSRGVSIPARGAHAPVIVRNWAVGGWEMASIRDTSRCAAVHPKGRVRIPPGIVGSLGPQRIVGVYFAARGIYATAYGRCGVAYALYCGCWGNRFRRRRWLAIGGFGGPSILFLRVVTRALRSVASTIPVDSRMRRTARRAGAHGRDATRAP